jgi:dTDP-4-dehydrorhamnose 3,5-epimerase
MSERFEVVSTPLAGLLVLKRKPIVDARGWFERFYCIDEFAECGLVQPVVQMNRTLTQTKGSVRGMHFQRHPHQEGKVVNCLRGRVWDVAVDLRTGSPTYLHWHAEILSADNHCALVIPEGFAHGFQTLEDDCELLYLHTTRFAPTAADGLNPSDTALAITWPLPITELSEGDRNRPLLTPQFRGLLV